jgi:hypothetical protein
MVSDPDRLEREVLTATEYVTLPLPLPALLPLKVIQVEPLTAFQVHPLAVFTVAVN